MRVKQKESTQKKSYKFKNKYKKLRRNDSNRRNRHETPRTTHINERPYDEQHMICIYFLVTSLVNNERN